MNTNVIGINTNEVPRNPVNNRQMTENTNECPMPKPTKHIVQRKNNDDKQTTHNQTVRNTENTAERDIDMDSNPIVQQSTGKICKNS